MAVALPVSVIGLEGAEHVMIEQLSLRLRASDGRMWQTRKTMRHDLRAYLQVSESYKISQQSLLPDRSVIESIGGSASRIEGAASIRPYRLRKQSVLPPVFPQTDVPGLGRCSSFMAVPLFGEEMLKVVCESPETPAPLGVGNARRPADRPRVATTAG